jgi:hypothetical protein
MNERLKELAREAKLLVYNPNGVPTKLEKFAELIVRECIDIVNRHEYSYHEADPLWETAQLIKEHFGVKE